MIIIWWHSQDRNILILLQADECVWVLGHERERENWKKERKRERNVCLLTVLCFSNFFFPYSRESTDSIDLVYSGWYNHCLDDCRRFTSNINNWNHADVFIFLRLTTINSKRDMCTTSLLNTVMWWVHQPALVLYIYINLYRPLSSSDVLGNYNKIGHMGAYGSSKTSELVISADPGCDTDAAQMYPRRMGDRQMRSCQRHPGVA